MTTVAERPDPAVPAAFDPEEWKLRVELAACYRLFDYLGWTELIFNHITVRVPGPEHHFLINPFGLHYSEVTASNLVKVALDGEIIGSKAYPINPAGYVIHSAIHAAVPEALCIMHTHTTAGMAVASSRRGLAPTNFHSTHLVDEAAYHDFEGVTVRDDEKPRLVKSLGSKKVLILRNHGLLVHGATIADAFFLLHRLERACEVQVATETIDEGITVPAEVCRDSHRRAFAEPVSATARMVFDAMIRLVDKKDASYKR